MKTIIRNFINVLIRFKVATFLNVAGLAVAFAAFLIIMVQVSFEHNFDRCHPNSTPSTSISSFTIPSERLLNTIILIGSLY